jgi:anti-sigma factor RsiW
MDDSVDHSGHVRLSLGLYVLGALDEAASQRVRTHLRACDSCRAEHEYIAVVPMLFNLLSPDDLADALLDHPNGPAGPS